MIKVFEYKGIQVAEIDEVLHSGLMRYWIEDIDEVYEKDYSTQIVLPDKNIFNYLYCSEKDKTWDPICVMEMNDRYHLFREEFIQKEYALRWIANEYLYTDELKEEDRMSSNKELWEQAKVLAKQLYIENYEEDWELADEYDKTEYIKAVYVELERKQK